MTTSREAIVAQFRQECDNLRASIEAYAPGTCVAEVEKLAFDSVLKIALEALSLFFCVQSEQIDGPSVIDHEGRELRALDRRPGTYYSIFGEVIYKRSYYHTFGPGIFAVDCAVNVPAGGASDFRRSMEQTLSMGLSFADVGEFMKRYFAVPASTRGVQESILIDSAEAQNFEQQQVPPTIQAPILVVQSDNKCVPVVQRQQGGVKQGADGSADQAKSAEPGRLKGERRREGKMKEATLATVSLHVPFIRTPEEVHASLFRKSKQPRTDLNPGTAPDLGNESALDSAPSGYTDSDNSLLYKRVWASMDGKRPTLRKAAHWAERMKTEATQYLVRLCDGQPALQKANTEVLPNYTPVLDLIHALSKLWAAADIKYGRKGNTGWLWVHDASLRLLKGQSAGIVSELDKWLEAMPEGEPKIQMGNIANYLEQNEELMRYDKFLALGWPIASGIIEGACRHVVKDRVERSGMGWTIEGVSAFLQMRCLYLNGDWDTYQTFRIAKRAENSKWHLNQTPGESNVYMSRDLLRYREAV